ncbi:MAG TPA: ATP-dependent DNA ligase [Dehalococcoidia bacterium]|nr:ATP-dependent DNA ligase [Dehalococcoidia bacterium]
MAKLTLPVQPPIPPMLAKLTPEIPSGGGWLYEPKWDGFRAIVFYDGEECYLQSRDLKPLARYFPELQQSLCDVLPEPMVLDGEVVIMTDHGLDFDALQMRIHPAESRVRKLAAETPSSFVAFDMLAEGTDDLMRTPFEERRARLERALADVRRPAHLTPATRDRALAQDWFNRFEGAGLDGVIAKRLADAYQPDVRAMLKIKHLRTVDCVVAGLRWYKGEPERAVGSLLLGLYDDTGVLHHVGHTSSFKAPERRALADEMRPLITDDENAGFGRGRTPGTPSRWTGGKDMDWVRLRPERVCEVTFDYLQGNRFRHAATFKRWRPDKPPEACTFEQIETTVPYELAQVFAG